ncbi:GvpL/GvpF family gas vesicle protein [Phytohabitans rumicis]|uniref:Uncharacterized protein n=1 Tax=Phytohabitans rumicis TaxID=1076125 RepID=A0A6V8LLK8_9ACTN|nr:GvpL/GvpF family gas vesicle protein [Phytohabitans rumicis]GFJ95881.1 hypothetical protein Prum_095230 [Phytohabitans rumicis]
MTQPIRTGDSLADILERVLDKGVVIGPATHRVRRHRAGDGHRLVEPRPVPDRGHHHRPRAGEPPLRFGALCASRDDVLLVLDSLRPRLRAGLARVAGAGEWTVRLVGAEPRTEAEAAATAATSGTAWMLSRRAGVRARERWSKAATAVCGALAQHARETCVAKAGMRYLVGRTLEDERPRRRVAAAADGPDGG